MTNKSQPQAPKPDVSGARAPFAVLPEKMQPRVNENDRAYGCFLLWCMMAPTERSKRMLAKAMGIGDSTIRYWSQKHNWNRRMEGVSRCEWEALKGYRQLMNLQVGSGQAAALRVAMDVVLDRAGLAYLRHAVAAQRNGASGASEGASEGASGVQGGPGGDGKQGPNTGDSHRHSTEGAATRSTAFSTPLSDNELETLDVNRHMADLRNSILKEHLAVKDLKRQVLLIDACLGLIAKKVQTGELEVSIKDIPPLLKARALLTGLPTEQVAVQHQHQHEHTVAVESMRMREARKKGGHALQAAMRDELDELNVIMGAIPRKMEVIDIVPSEPQKD